MTEMSNLYELFGIPSYSDKNSIMWTTPVFYSVYYDNKNVHISMSIHENLLKYPLTHNTSYSYIKQLLVVRSGTLSEALYSVLLALGIDVNYDLSNKELYSLLYEKIDYRTY